MLPYHFPLVQRMLVAREKCCCTHRKICRTVWYCMAKFSRFFFISGFNRGFFAGLQDSKPKPVVKCLNKVKIVRKWIPWLFAARITLSYCRRLMEIVRPSFLSHDHHGHSFFGTSLLLWSINFPEILNLLIDWWKAFIAHSVQHDI